MRFTEPAQGDLEGFLRTNPQLVRWALKKCILLERDPEAGEPLHRDLAGYRKLVIGDRHWRIVWRVTHDDVGTVIVDVAEVWAVGARSDGDIYQEMLSRVASLPDEPRTVALADLVGRFGKLAEGIEPTAVPHQEELPGWLVDRLVGSAGMEPEKVRSLSLEEAVDAWTAWTMGR